LVWEYETSAWRSGFRRGILRAAGFEKRSLGGVVEEVWYEEEGRCGKVLNHQEAKMHSSSENTGVRRTNMSAFGAKRSSEVDGNSTWLRGANVAGGSK
jgi:hypothetical protein